MRKEGDTKVAAEVLAGEVLPVGCRHTQSVSGAMSHAPAGQAGAVWCPLAPASPIACLLLSAADAWEEERMAGVKARILKRP